MLGEELRADVTRAKETEHEKGDARKHHRPSVAHGPAEQSRVARVEGVESALDGVIKRAEGLGRFALQAQQTRAKHRRQREGSHGGNDHDDAHHPAQLFEEHAGHARDHRQGEEHGDHRQRGGDDRDGHLVCAMYSRLRRRRAALDVGRNVLQDHDGVVHHHTDGDRKRRERDDVDRVARDGQIDERGDEREWDGDRNDQRGPPATEKEEDDKHDEEQGVEHRLREAVDGLEDVLRRVPDDAQLHVGRQVLLQLGQLGEYLLSDVDGVGAGLLLYDDRTAADGVRVSLLRAFLHGVDHPRHVAQVDVRTADRPDYDALHLAGVLELTLHTQRVRLVTDVKATAGDVAILCADDGADGFDGQVVGLQFGGVAIDLDLALGCTVDRHGTHAGDSRQGVGHVVVEDLVERLLTLSRLDRQD